MTSSRGEDARSPDDPEDVEDRHEEDAVARDVEQAMRPGLLGAAEPIMGDLESRQHTEPLAGNPDDIDDLRYADPPPGGRPEDPAMDPAAPPRSRYRSLAVGVGILVVIAAAVTAGVVFGGGN